MPNLPPPIECVLNPYSKLTFLCDEARRRGSKLTSFAAVARRLDVSPGLISHLFGFLNEADGLAVKTSETLAHLEGLARVFSADGLALEPDWFYLEYDAFVARVAAVPVSSAMASSDDWNCDQTLRLQSLVELRLHPPGPTGEVQTTLLFGTARCEYESDEGQERRAVAIGLRDARFAIDSGSYRLAPGTMLGEREETKDLKNFTRVAGGIEITGPIVDGVLKDDPFANHYLGVIERANAKDEPFAVTVAAHRRSFVVTDADKELQSVPLSENKDAILNTLVLRRCERDEENRAVLAHATLQHR